MVCHQYRIRMSSVIGEQTQKHPRKRRREEISNDEGQFTYITSDQRPFKSLACPFYKSDPVAHPQCARLNLSRVSYVKQHLARRHAPRYFCLRCYATFDAQLDLSMHQRQDPPCHPLPPRLLPFISWEQLTALKARSNAALDEARQWNEIWNLLFPGVPCPVDPYVYLDLPDEVNDFRNHIAQELPRLLGQRLSLGDSLRESREEMDKIIKDIVMEVSDHWIERRRPEASALTDTQQT